MLDFLSFSFGLFFLQHLTQPLVGTTQLGPCCSCEDISSTMVASYGDAPRRGGVEFSVTWITAFTVGKLSRWVLIKDGLSLKRARVTLGLRILINCQTVSLVANIVFLIGCITPPTKDIALYRVNIAFAGESLKDLAAIDSPGQTQPLGYDVLPTYWYWGMSGMFHGSLISSCCSNTDPARNMRRLRSDRRNTLSTGIPANAEPPHNHSAVSRRQQGQETIQGHHRLLENDTRQDQRQQTPRERRHLRDGKQSQRRPSHHRHHPRHHHTHCRRVAPSSVETKPSVLATALERLDCWGRWCAGCYVDEEWDSRPCQ